MAYDGMRMRTPKNKPIKVIKLSSQMFVVLHTFVRRAKRLIGKNGEVSILVTDNASMQELNRRFRKKNKPTDVLSFPSDVRGYDGDIAISKEIASANAKRFRHSVETELKILL